MNQPTDQIAVCGYRKRCTQEATASIILKAKPSQKTLACDDHLEDVLYVKFGRHGKRVEDIMAICLCCGKEIPIQDEDEFPN